MTPRDRMKALVERATATPERLLVLYVTLGDPVTCDPPELLAAAVAAGADVLELGLPTPGTRPRGDEVRRSFERALAAPHRDLWDRCRDLRARCPDVALLPLVYSETIQDLGIDHLVDGATASGMDGLVLVEPSPQLLARVAEAGLSAIPVIKPDLGAERTAALEAHATHLTYRTLATRTGDDFDLESARRAVAELATSASRPFIVGFGIRGEAGIAALAEHAAGVVIGSELIRILRGQPPGDRVDALSRIVATWRAAAVRGTPAS